MKISWRERRTWKATSFEAIPTTTSDGTRSVGGAVFLVVGNDSRNPLDFEHHFCEIEEKEEEKEEEEEDEERAKVCALLKMLVK